MDLSLTSSAELEDDIYSTQIGYQTDRSADEQCYQSFNFDIGDYQSLIFLILFFHDVTPLLFSLSFLSHTCPMTL